MHPTQPQISGQLDQALLDHIESLVETKVSEHLGDPGTQRRIETAGQGPGRTSQDRATIVAFSGDMDKLFAAFAIATGAAALDMQVSIFFTFWGLNAVRRTRQLRGKALYEKVMALMLPSGPARLGTSKMNMWGAGPAFFRYVMRRKKVSALPDLVGQAQALGVRLVACRTSMDVMGIRPDELIDGLEYGGVTTYLADARDSKITLFV